MVIMNPHLERLGSVRRVKVRLQLSDVAHDGVLAVEALEVRGPGPVARRQQVHDLGKERFGAVVVLLCTYWQELLRIFGQKKQGIARCV